MKKAFILLAIIVGIGSLIASARTPPTFAQEPTTLTLWHAWQGEEKTFVEQKAATYQDAQIEITTFETEDELQSALLGAAANNGGPDLYLGPDRWKDQLIEEGLANAYCLPGQCPECEGANPPPWCRYASGNFDYSRNQDFHAIGLCRPDEPCDFCTGNDIPRWCWAANLDPATAPDIFQAGFADQFDDGVFPIGIPIWWDSPLVFVRPGWWFIENVQDLPFQSAEVVELEQNEPGAIYLDESVMNGLPEPLPYSTIVDAARAEPEPQPWQAGLLASGATGVLSLWEEAGPLYLTPLRDYRPQPDVQGIYMNPNTDNKTQALDFAYMLADEDSQVELFNASGRLPTHGDAWEAIAPAEPAGLVAGVEAPQPTNLGRQSLQAFLGTSDLPYIQLPELQPEFDSNTCGQVASTYYQQFTDNANITDAEKAHALFSTRQFASMCRRAMPTFTEGPCAEEAETFFANKLASEYHTPGSIMNSRTAAERTFEACRSDTPPDTLTVWHAWQNNEKTLLEDLAANYPESTIELVGFDTEENLREELGNVEEGASIPDLYIGPHTWADDLIESGLADAYCLPNQCEECRGPNAPSWCPYATGNFGHGRNTDFGIAGLCRPGQCPQCFGDTPPRWCKAANLDPALAPDIFQMSFATIINDDPFPIGIPIWWEHVGIAIRPGWFIENEQLLPESVDDIVQRFQDDTDIVHLDESLFDGHPIPFPADRLRNVFEGDPGPQPSVAGVLVSRARGFPSLQEQAGPLLQTPLSDYQPQLKVQGVYMNPNTENKSQALDFAYVLADEDTQMEIFAQSGRLPTHNEAWADAVEQQQTSQSGVDLDRGLVEFGRQSMLGFVGNQPEIDLDTLIPPEFGDGVCGQVAQQRYEEMTSMSGFNEDDRAEAVIFLQEFATVCRFSLPDYGDGFCARRAEYTFAKAMATRYDMPGGFAESKNKAEDTFNACKNWMHEIVRPDLGGRLEHRVGQLDVTVNVPASALTQEIDMVIQSDADTSVTTGTRLLGTVFSINAYQRTTSQPITRFEQTITISVGYTDSQLGRLNEISLALFYWDIQSDQWVKLSNSTVDEDNNQVTAELDHLTTFAVRGLESTDNGNGDGDGDEHGTYVPLIMK